MRNILSLKKLIMIIWLGLTHGLIHCAREPIHPVKHLPDQFQFHRVREAFLYHLDHEILPFWTSSRLHDEKYGGFVPWIKADLKHSTKGEKHLIVHLRLLFIHALAIASSCPKIDLGRVRAQYVEQMKFLTEKFWDPGDEAWYLNLTRDGRPIKSTGIMIGQAYVIYIMSEIYRLIRDEAALELAEKTFRFVDETYYDARFGGYFESRRPSGNDKENGKKSVSAHFHMMLALSRLIQFSDEQIYTQRLEELFHILTSYSIISDSRNVCMMCTRDWKKRLTGDNPEEQTLYGHNAEFVWYTIQVAEALGRNLEEIQPWLDTLARGVIENGVGNNGAVYVWGPIEGSPSDTSEIRWWPQCEVMIMLIRMYELTGNEAYWSLFETVARFTFDKMVPDHSGAWLGGIDLRDGTLFDRGGWALKSGFHVSRMLLECGQTLENLDKSDREAK